MVAQRPRRPCSCGFEDGLDPTDAASPFGRVPRRVQQVEDEGEVLRVVADMREQRFGMLEVGLADDDRAVLVERAADRAQVRTRARMMVEVAATIEAFDPGRVIGIAAVLADEMHDVRAEPTHAASHPEAQDIELRVTQRWGVPVDVRLLRKEVVQVVLAGALVEGPGRLVGEVSHPVVGRAAVGRRIAPHVPVAVRILSRAPCRLEPAVLVRRVVGDEVEPDLDAARSGISDETVEVRERPEHRIDVTVVGHVVAEVRHGRAIER